MPSRRRLSERQQQMLIALHRVDAFGHGEPCSVRSLVARRELADSRYAGPLAGLEEAGLVAKDREGGDGYSRNFKLWWLTPQGRRAAEDLRARRLPAAGATVRVLEADRSLAEAVDERARAQAEDRAVAELVAVEPGAWTPEFSDQDWHRGLGLLVLEGLLAREVSVSKRAFLELLGPGDLLRPWAYEREVLPSVAAPAKWEVLARAHLAVLDRRFTLRLSSCPEVLSALLDRAVERSRSLAVQSALRQGGRLEERLLLTLWHLARRWGEIDGQGVVVRLVPLSPQVLARMAATTPAAADEALRHLQAIGTVDRIDSEGWRLSRTSEVRAALAGAQRGQ